MDVKVVHPDNNDLTRRYLFCWTIGNIQFVFMRWSNQSDLSLHLIGLVEDDIYNLSVDFGKGGERACFQKCMFGWCVGDLEIASRRHCNLKSFI